MSDDRWRRIAGRVFGDAEHPMGWALTLGRVAGIRVRVHLFFIVYIVAQMLWSIPRDTIGPAYQAIILAVLFTLVLLHEFGHCVACRRVKGEADDILLWPLGGLASCAPPRTWRANLVTVVGGPAVNLLLVPVFAGALWLAGHADTIVFNPFRPSVALGAFGSYALASLWIAHWLNLTLLAFNVLCPMFPLDGGRIVQCLIWARTSERRSMEISVVVGFITAAVLGVVALVSNETILLGIAVFGGLICYDERRKLRLDDALGGAEYLIAEDRAEREQRAREREQEEKHEVEVDRVLAKIASSGMGSLTRGEKKVLERETARRGGS